MWSTNIFLLIPFILSFPLHSSLSYQRPIYHLNPYINWFQIPNKYHLLILFAHNLILCSRITTKSLHKMKKSATMCSIPNLKSILLNFYISMAKTYPVSKPHTSWSCTSLYKVLQLHALWPSSIKKTSSTTSKVFNFPTEDSLPVHFIPTTSILISLIYLILSLLTQVPSN